MTATLLMTGRDKRLTDSPRVQDQDHGYAQPALGGPQAAEFSDSLLVRSRRLELPIEQIMSGTGMGFLAAIHG